VIFDPDRLEDYIAASKIHTALHKI